MGDPPTSYLTTGSKGEPQVDLEAIRADIAAQLEPLDPYDAWRRLRDARWGPLAEHRLSLDAHRLQLLRDTAELLVLPSMAQRIQFLPHQVNAAKKVLHRMDGRALLADEVGLGKTIEAGLVMKELVVRNLAERILILTPASLVPQWQAELSDKFDEKFLRHDDPRFQGFDKHSRIIASIDTAKLDRNVPDIIAAEWDLVVIDEAHYLKNRSTLRYKLAENLSTKYLLMLTATPIQNNLKELFNLIHLLKPGLLGTEDGFARQFMDDTQGRELRNGDELQRLLAGAMIRNRRAETGIEFTGRIVRTERIPASEKEYALHERIENFIRDHYTGRIHLPLMMLQREVASSTRALLSTLRHMKETGVFGMGPAPRRPGTESGANGDEAAPSPTWAQADAQEAFAALTDAASRVKVNAKARKVKKILERIDDKVILYTQFRATQNLLVHKLRAAGFAVTPFHGGLGSARKQEALREFREKTQVLVCTDAGSEGLNLQFAHILVNYDLPWNPMRVEQRIGRVHRIGQRHDVVIVNLTVKDTIEDYVLKVLYDKIKLFEVAIGEMDLILSQSDTEGSLEKQILDIVAKSKDRKGIRTGLTKLSKRLEKGKGLADEIRAFDEDVFRQFDLGTMERGPGGADDAPADAPVGGPTDGPTGPDADRDAAAARPSAKADAPNEDDDPKEASP